MNWLIILGIIVIGSGTYLIYLGTDLTNKKSQKDIVKKIENTQSSIESLKNLARDDSLDIKIKNVETEFNEWADDFLKNIETKKLKIEKKKITTLESRIEESKKWLPGYKNFLDVIKKSLDAFNLKTKSNIKYNLPQIPNNIFINSEINYTGTIFFKNNIIWEIAIIPPDEMDNNYKPGAFIYMYDKNVMSEKYINRQSQATDILYLSSSEDSKIYYLKLRNNKFNFDYLESDWIDTNPEKTFSKVAIDLIEANLLQI